MRVLFRADGGSAIGWGHMSRCAALASALEGHGVTVAWACREEPGLTNFTGRDPEFPLPGSASFDDLPLSEVEVLASRGTSFDWVVVDHYGAGTPYVNALRERLGARILLMEDHQVRSGADLRLAPMQSEASDTLWGPEYLLMRDCFDPARWPPSSDRSGLLICFGGADLAGDTRAALEALQGSSKLSETVTVIASDVLAQRQGLDALIEELGEGFERLSWVEGPDLAERFARVATALVSSSVLAFEALAMGAPVVALECVENQRHHAATLRRLGVPSVQGIGEAVRLVLSREAVGLPLGRIDANGAHRVATRIRGEEERKR